MLPQASTESEILATVEAVASGLVVLHPDVVEYLLPLTESSWRSKVVMNPVPKLLLLVYDYVKLCFKTSILTWRLTE
ncbi:hypothetical protein [Iningainema tapete]|uniref:Uncharacterized protein n=1 Tax=Iningainema tapete BLCC-T55 TaxID=2748662 RepID=A0A8J6XCS0_9CYAN|nr:hypothetical protein [Iningainema tapete]MBD2770723.1 hypothetical protein [Iningainema tapete BLCC-T55]